MKIRNSLNVLNKIPKAIVKPLQLSCLALTLLGTTGQAGSLDNFMGDMYSNTTSAGVFSTQQRGIISGGSYVGRFGIKSINLVNFDPPRVSAGCGGINLFGGAFSFINAQQLTQILRGIAQNALGLLFQLGLNAISQPLSSLLSTWSSKLQSMNSLLKNSCEAARKLFQIDTSGQSMMNALTDGIQEIGTQSGKFKDAFSGTMGRFEKGWQELTARKPENGLTSGDKAINELPNVGNVTWRAINATDSFKAITPVNGGDEYQSKIMLMNFIGTEIIDATNQAQPTDGSCSTGANRCEPKPSIYRSVLTMKDLIAPEANKPFYHCQADDTGDEACQTLPLQSGKLIDNFRGVVFLVNKNLYGIQSSEINLSNEQIVAAINAGQGIVGKAGKPNLNSALTQEEKAFMNLSGSQVIYYASRVNHQPDQVVLISEFLRPILVEDIVVKLATALYDSAVLTFNGSEVKATPPADYMENMKRWKAEIAQYSSKKRLENFNQLEALVNSVANTMPVNSVPVNVAPR